MKKKKIFALMAAALSLAACSTNDIADITHDDADNVVNVASVTRSGEGGTTTSTIPMTAPFHLINQTQQTEYGWKYEADYAYDATKSEYAPQNGGLVVWCNIKDDNGAVVKNQFQAFSPLRTVANQASFSKFQILPDQSTAEKLAAADWMTAEPAAITKSDAPNEGLKLEFSHKNAKLHFDVSFKGDVAASNITLSSDNFKVVDFITPCYTATDNSKTIDAIVYADKDYSNNNLIEVTINGETYVAPIPSNLIKFDAGKQYNFNLAIGHDQASISSVYVTEWDDSKIELNGDDDALLEGYKVVIDPETGVRTFTVSNYDAFKLWAQTSDVENTNITLDGDITVPDGETLPSIDSFNGTFDGNGHTIKTTLYNSESQKGLLINSNNGIIKNLNIEIVNGTTDLNGIVYENYGTIEYCTIDGKVTADNAFGISRVNFGKIIACTNNADFSGCTNNSAGISSYEMSYTSNRPTIIGCINNGKTKTAGITVEVGHHWNSDIPGTMISCVNTGQISDGGYALYHIFATGSSMKNCYWTSGNQSDYDSNKASESAGGQVTGGWTEDIINNLNTATDNDAKSIQDYGYEFKVEDGKLIIVPYTSSSSAARR